MPAKVTTERLAWRRTAMAAEGVVDVACELSRSLKRLRVPHALAGGLAVGFYGFNRMTENVDLVVPRSRLRTIEERFGPTSPGPLQGLRAEFDGIPVNFQTVRTSDLRSTSKLAGVPVIGLAALVAMKVVAGRNKDTLDVSELLKTGKVSIRSIEQRLKRNPEALESFAALVTIVNLEMQGLAKQSRQHLMAWLEKNARRRVI